MNGIFPLILGLCFLASLLVSTFITAPLTATTSVMLGTVVLAGIGYAMQAQRGEGKPVVAETTN